MNQIKDFISIHIKIIPFILIFIILNIIFKIHKKKKQTKIVDFDFVTIRYKQIQDAVEKVAINITKDNFLKNKKQIYTKQNDFRLSFINSYKKKSKEIEKICFDKNGYFNLEFCDYVNSNFLKITFKQLPKIILKYFLSNQNNVSKQNDFITVKQFFELKEGTQNDFVGIYIIRNEKKNKYYVGQAKRILFRLNQHFTGHGNGDVYVDYRNGDKFKVQIIKMNETNFTDLDELESFYIQKYDSFNNGYNKTHGNNRK